ncbi:hypothetical protein EQG49_00665 [Periweissella cryptocerci]|uniref:Uncharacterized protein n=1 Tax=Periweissella cryptocerci TaxID=2506420 RepID=A0A4P6YR41_9LACO|nr:hypothetical protein [Periweissella cryptocerci]QBO35066.1 hypothetical protein EQG49_00665 [Periweissella cryptocerci]
MRFKIGLSIMPILLEFGIISSFIATIIGVHAIKLLFYLGFGQFVYIALLLIMGFIINQTRGISKFGGDDKQWLTGLTHMWLLTLLMVISATIIH